MTTNQLQPVSGPGQDTVDQDQPVNDPGQATVGQDQPANGPGLPTVDQGQPVNDPGQPTTGQDQTVDAPSQVAVDQVPPVSKPGQATTGQDQPVNNPGQVTTVQTQPVNDPGQATTGQDQPADSAVQPTVDQVQPVNGPGQPTPNGQDTPGSNLGQVVIARPKEIVDQPEQPVGQTQQVIGQWQCPTGPWGVWAPVRRNTNNDIECASWNARDCLWKGSIEECEQTIRDEHLDLVPAKSISLICGDQHRQVYGYNGYDQDTFCSRFWNLLPQYPPRSTWRCLDGVNAPVRVNALGDIECMSGNRRDCVWQATHSDCEAVLANPPNPTIPLPCGRGHMAEWGFSGYTRDWCNIAAREFGLVKKSPSSSLSCGNAGR